MTIRSIEDIRQDHDDYVRWQRRPNRYLVPRPAEANWRDVGLLFTYLDQREAMVDSMESVLAKIGERFGVAPGDVNALLTEIESATAEKEQEQNHGN